MLGPIIEEPVHRRSSTGRSARRCPSSCWRSCWSSWRVGSPAIKPLCAREAHDAGWQQIYLWAVLLFLYLPILVMMVMAFNRSPLYELPFDFDLVWFKALAEQRAAAAGELATASGSRSHQRRDRHDARHAGGAMPLPATSSAAKRVLQLLLFPPIAIPWLIIGTAMLIFFFWTGIGRGLHAILLGHVALSLPYVIVVVGARLRDLRACDWRRRRRRSAPRRGRPSAVITLPILAPGVIGGGAVRLRRLLRPVRHLLFPGAARHVDAAGRDLHRDPQGLHAGDQRHLDHHHPGLDGPDAAGRALLQVRRGALNEPGATSIGASKAYGAAEGARRCHASHFADGEFFGLLGPSGSGKTTLLRAHRRLRRSGQRQHQLRRRAGRDPCRCIAATSAWCSRTMRCFPT